MKRAIAIPYCVDQNEPSIPVKQVLELPDDVTARNELLKDIFIERVCDVERDDLTVKKGKRNDYGDLVVVYGDGDMFLYVTFVE